MARFKNADWDLQAAEDNKNSARTWEDAKIAVLMDIRDELQKLNRVFECPNALEIPHLLRQIKRNTTKPRKRRVKKETA